MPRHFDNHIWVFGKIKFWGNFISDFLPLFVFVFVGLFTPGPNIILLTISGAKFGIRDTYPHLFGVVIGTGFLAAFSSLGINTIMLKISKKETEKVKRKIIKKIIEVILKWE